MANFVPICALMSIWMVSCWAQSRSPKILALVQNQTTHSVNTIGTNNSIENVIVSLRMALADRYQRGPILIIQDSDPTILIGAQVIWEKALQEGPISRDFLILPYNSTGSGPLIRARKSDLFLKMLAQLDSEEILLNNSKSASLIALYRGLESIPFDGSIILVAGRRSDVEFLSANISTRLTTKRIKLHLLWIGIENGDEKILRELSERSGGKYIHADPTAFNLKYHLMESNEMETNSQNNVLLAFRWNLFQDIELPFLVDSSMSILHIQITGEIKAARLLDPQGTWIDLQVEPRFGVDERLAGGGELPGEWNLKITRDSQKPNSPPYHIAIQGESLLRVQASKGNTQNNENEDLDVKIFFDNAANWTEYKFLDKFGVPIESNDRMDTQFDIKDNQDLHFYESPHYIQVKGTMDNGEPFSRVAWVSEGRYAEPKLTQIFSPVAAWVTSTSQLSGLPGTQGRIIIQVSNNRDVAIRYVFTVSDSNNFINNLIPTQTLMGPWQTILVEVRYQIDQRAPIGLEDEILFILQGPDGSLERRAILRVESSVDDKEPPTVTYKVNIKCNREEDNASCHNKHWSADITFNDYRSGLLQIIAEPSGLIFKEDFIAGTRSPITAKYSSSCCRNKLLLTAIDVGGNSISYTINSTDGVLSMGEIAAIVLGVLLFIALLITIIVCIVICRRRRILRIKQVAT